MQIVKVKPDIINMFSIDPEMLRKESRPCVLVVKLKYKNSLYDFAVPIRSNISASSPKDEYFQLPSRYATKKSNRHGIHYIKMFPISKQFYSKYHTDNGIMSALIKAVIDQNASEIIEECQAYLDRYSAGIRPQYATDLDLLISILFPTA